MIRIFRNVLPYFAVTACLFVYLYFLNRFHFIHAEQMQLFRFDKKYILETISVPGGISLLLEKFLIQFNYYPVVGILLFITLLAFAFLLILKIWQKHGFTFHYPALVPVSLLISLQLHHQYCPGSTLSFVFFLALFYLYLHFKKAWLKNLSVILLPTVAYILTGNFGIWLWITLLIHGIFIARNTSAFVVAIASLSGLLLLYLTGRFMYVSPHFSATEILASVNSLNFYSLCLYVLLWLFVPLSLFFIKRTAVFMAEKPTRAIVFFVSLILIGVSFDYKTEQLFKIEYYFFKEEDSKVIDLVAKYPEENHLVLYFGNIALSRTSQMGDRLFHFKQSFGPDALYITNIPDKISTLYGGELYRNLLYTNEARHRVFNSLIINGENPGALKKLTVYELVNRNYAVAKKYLTLLSQTLFYKEWALNYYKFIKHPLLISSDEEMALFRKYTATHDFYHDRFDLQLHSLLALYPDNRPAFDYLIAYTLMRKDLRSFLEALAYLRAFRMNTLPVHVEEALLVCRYILPEKAAEIDNFTIREETKRQFDKYVRIFELNGNNPKNAYKKLAEEFKNTYWFYLDFSPYVTPESVPNVQIFPY